VPATRSLQALESVEHGDELITLSAEHLLGAREAARLLLDHLGLRNYRYDVEPAERAFEVFVEHERGGAWHEVKLREPADVLLASARDERARAQVAERWRERLCGR
jgi:hypothetical protein